MEGRRHAFHLCACRTEEHGKAPGTERELAWLKGAEGETAEGAPWVGIAASRVREVGVKGNRKGKARPAFSPCYYWYPT